MICTVVLHIAVTGFYGRQTLVMLHPVITRQLMTAQSLWEVKGRRNRPVDSRPNSDGKLLVVIKYESGKTSM